MSGPETERLPPRDSFLPDFCALPMVFGVVVLSELFAFVLVLAGSEPADFWEDLALVSLFIQWAGLSGAAVLCALRRPLSRLGDTAAGLTGYLLLLTVVLVLSEVSYHAAITSIPGREVEHLPFLARNLAVGAIIAGIILRYFYVIHQWRGKVKAESEARLQALQARIRPHFLFNSLNSVAALAHDRPDLAERALEDLADLIRASLAEGRALVALSDERALAAGYIELERLRLGDRLQVEWDLDDVPDETAVPPLVLQPLLENAVHHGIEPLPGGGTVRVTGRVAGGSVELEVANPEPPGPSPHADGNRMAMDNIRQRLAARWDGRAGLTVEREGGEYRVTLKIPFGAVG